MASFWNLGGFVPGHALASIDKTSATEPIPNWVRSGAKTVFAPPRSTSNHPRMIDLPLEIRVARAE
jgi:hypothetical protein